MVPHQPRDPAIGATLPFMHTVTHMKWDSYVYEEVILPQVGADLGVRCGPCRFQRAAGL